MHRAVDLLVEGGVLHEPLNTGVAADPELAEAPCALVGVERVDQEVLAGARGGVDDAPRLEHEARTFDLLPVVDGGELGELDHAFGRILDRRVEDLPARHVHVPVLDRAGATGQRHRQVGACADETHLLCGIEDVCDHAHAGLFGIPVAQHGVEDELRVLRERHPRVVAPATRRDTRRSPTVRPSPSSAPASRSTSAAAPSDAHRRDPRPPVRSPAPR